MLLGRAALRLLRPAQQSCRNTTNTTFTLSPDELTYPDSLSPNHHDLPSFLEYASRVKLDPNSTTFVGTQYEYTAQSALEQLGMSLKRIGGKSDLGIDLLGTWQLPSTPEPLKVLVQCKALAKKMEPAHARELEGAVVGAPMGWRNGVLGLLIAQKSPTKGVREALGRSRWPMGYVLCGADGKLLQILWNRRAEEEGLEGIGVGLKYEGGDVTQKEIFLTWKGEPIQRQKTNMLA